MSDLTRITFDLFLAGNETTSDMTRWFLIYMTRFQEIQEKIQEEIDRVVPRDTLPGLQHRNQLRNCGDVPGSFESQGPTYFKDPDKFDPSRFLDKNGKYIPTCDGFQAFGIGKRQCLGEQFARMELYLITASLLQNFTFAPPEGEREMSIAPDKVPIGHNPRKEQKFSIKCRN
ncbi:Cholesterol side-chain cleavage enzyme, mitochondrial [Armadillidium nasatum]|uniref:Cholesterol side-chain cleavage enzyme, mitochondrial n=1 Tax=Armadillidium nasatum TaxID=96803 RepID=A0A5N5SQZ8_9CRUS|nr:Cholesterol side-chain cleavage enzyme, mitochondrial [Armadillidium nasatum]